MEHTEENVVAIIMAGGAGKRFWPLSTEAKPKQFLSLFDDRSLLQKSFDRISGLIPHHRVLILTNEAFVPLVREQLPQVPAENIIGEPVRRDTAGAVALGAVLCRKRFGNPVIITLTADHMIEPTELLSPDAHFRRPFCAHQRSALHLRDPAVLPGNGLWLSGTRAKGGRRRRH